MRIVFFLFVMLHMHMSSFFGQELQCEVSVTSDPGLDITTTEREVIAELKNVIYEFMNNTAWTKDQFEIEEKINCNIVLSIVAIPSPGRYSANLQVQSTRPVFNTTYNTPLFNYLDKNVTFSFERNAILVFAPNEFRNNLTSVLAFYAYMILGYDYDSFSLEGGSKWFTKAQEIVVLAQSGGGPGWRSNERGRDNRYWLVDNALQQLFKPLRACFYEYHRKGLDRMFENPTEARSSMFEALEKLVEVNTARPGSVNMNNFLQTKLNEFKGIFKDAEQTQKTEVVKLLKRLDPANGSKYEEIL